MKRREFVLKSSLLTTTILAPMSISSCNLNSATESNKIGIQLYSLRDEMVKDPNPKRTDQLKKDYSKDIVSPIQNVFKLTYSEVVDARNNSFINLHKNTLESPRKRRS